MAKSEVIESKRMIIPVITGKNGPAISNKGWWLATKKTNSKQHNSKMEKSLKKYFFNIQMVNKHMKGFLTSLTIHREMLFRNKIK